MLSSEVTVVKGQVRSKSQVTKDSYNPIDERKGYEIADHEYEIAVINKKRDIVATFPYSGEKQYDQAISKAERWIDGHPTNDADNRAVWRKEDFDKMVESGHFTIVSKQPYGYEVKTKSGEHYGVEVKDVMMFEEEYKGWKIYIDSVNNNKPSSSYASKNGEDDIFGNNISGVKKKIDGYSTKDAEEQTIGNYEGYKSIFKNGFIRAQEDGFTKYEVSSSMGAGGWTQADIKKLMDKIGSREKGGMRDAKDWGPDFVTPLPAGKKVKITGGTYEGMHATVVMGGDTETRVKVEGGNVTVIDNKWLNTLDSKMKDAEGEREFRTYYAWRAACKMKNPNVKFDGDEEICEATPGIGHWDGVKGVLYNTNDSDRSLAREYKGWNIYVDTDSGKYTVVKGDKFFNFNGGANHNDNVFKIQKIIDEQKEQ